MDFFLLSAIKAIVVAAVLLTTLAYLQWVERKVIAHIQARIGPSRVGPHGLLQPLADVIKLITKEDLLPPYVNKFFYLLAPFLAVTMALLSISVIPFGAEVQILGQRTWMQLADLNVGVLFVLAVSSMGVYGIALAGWASNNKYSLLGGLRSSAQLISYELPLSLAVARPAAPRQYPEPARDRAGAERILSRLPAAMAHLPGAGAADLQLHYFPDRRVRRDQPHPVRSSGSRDRAGRRIPHRVQQHEVRRVFHGRVRQHDHRRLDDDDPVPRRMAAAVSRFRSARTSSPRLCWPARARSASITACTRRGVWTGSRFPYSR